MPYVTRSSATRTTSDDDWWDRGPTLPGLNVDGGKEVDTGLVDLHGNKIVRTQPPIGFGRDAEH